MVLPKPTMHIMHNEISAITFSRVGSSNLRTFEMKLSISSGSDVLFSSIAREEYEYLEKYCLSKKILVRSEMAEGGEEGYGEADSDEEGANQRGAGDFDDDSESDDEDFNAGDSGSDVAEEFDEEYSSEEEGDDSNQKAQGPSSRGRFLLLMT